MPYKDKEKGKAANRESYWKYHDERIKSGRDYYQKTKEQKKVKSRLTHIKKYGLTQDDFQSMWEQQKGLCLICSEPLGIGIRCHIDHDHDTLIIRGLLCKSCNNGLGFFKDNPSLLRKAAKYIEDNKGEGNGLSNK